MHLLCYVIDESGSKFHDLILSGLKGLEKEYATLNKDLNLTNGYIETELFDESITVDLTGKTSVIKIYIKYGQFINLQNCKHRVELFELQFVDLLRYYDYFYRVDESLIEKYFLEIQNEYWYMEDKSFEKFSKWIECQEDFHWTKISHNDYIFNPICELE